MFTSSQQRLANSIGT